MAEADKGISTDNIKGLVLALSSSFFIGASFIVKKKGLKKAGASGLRAGKVSSFVVILVGFFFFLALKWIAFLCGFTGYLFALVGFCIIVILCWNWR